MAQKKLQQVFIEVLGLPFDAEVEELTYRGIEQWDSVAHMRLVSDIEDVFDIMLDTDDILNMSSFTKAREILMKYGVKYDA
jgi:acyl carrier protein